MTSETSEAEKQLQTLIDHAPRPASGRIPTPAEMDTQKKFKVQVKALLGELPHDSRLSYKSVMRQVKEKYAQPRRRPPAAAAKQSKKPEVTKVLRNGSCPPNATSGADRVGTSQFWQMQSPAPWPPQVDVNFPYKMVYLIRHGQSEGQLANNRVRSIDPSLQDCSLTEYGREQARNIPKLLSNEQLESIELVISSPLKRALTTSILGFPRHNILVNYDLRELGGSIPENLPKPTEEVLKDLQGDIRGREEAGLDCESLRPQGWPQLARMNQPPLKHRVRDIFQWLYNERDEKTFAVVCHYHIIRTANGGFNIPVTPENAVPFKCMLLKDGNLVIV